MVQTKIARDIYSVKAYDGFIGAYVHVAMYRNPADALRKVRELKKSRLESGYSDDVKMCHPPEAVVGAFLVAGNKIQ